ncbi:MAG: TRAP transporter substrate-binding protein [Spirochaetales bacterium]|jgi:TRAP-type C4-dicarboxylate transport system substrate-binding protein|nr:TRAP transporter substrate-binding protein [Spirochaetales bacterium]
MPFKKGRGSFFRRGLKCFCVCVSFLVFSGCSGAQRNIRLSYSIFFPPTHTQTLAAQEWAAHIEERTRGIVKIVLFPGETLTKSTRVYDGVVNGVSDLGMSAFAYTRGRFPLLEGLDLPLGYPDGETATKAANAIFRIYNPKELEDVQVMYLHAHGPGVLAVKKKIESLADLKGLKVRGTGLSAKIVESLGAVPVSMGQGDTYEALQRGVVEATLCPIETLKGWRQAEVIDRVLSTAATGYTTAMYVIMNRDRWNSLPEDVQGVFREVNESSMERQARAWDAADEESKALLKEMGKPVETLSREEEEAFVRAVNPMLEEWASALETRGMPGKAVLADLHRLVKGN